MENIFNTILKENNLKITKNRIAILNELDKMKNPTTAEEVFNSISKTSIEKYSLSSVYRALNHFCEKGIVKKTAEIDGTTYFQLDTVHSHSLICEKCKKIVPILHCPITPIIKNIENKTDFLVTGHHLEIKGICSNCKKKMSKDEIKELSKKEFKSEEHICKSKNCI